MIACVNVQKWKILCIAIEISHPFSCRFWKLTHKKASNRLILCAAIFSIRIVFFYYQSLERGRKFCENDSLLSFNFPRRWALIRLCHFLLLQRHKSSNNEVIRITFLSTIRFRKNYFFLCVVSEGWDMGSRWECDPIRKQFSPFPLLKFRHEMIRREIKKKSDMTRISHKSW